VLHHVIERRLVAQVLFPAFAIPHATRKGGQLLTALLEIGLVLDKNVFAHFLLDLVGFLHLASQELIQVHWEFAQALPMLVFFVFHKVQSLTHTCEARPLCIDTHIMSKTCRDIYPQ
jgi:hypothetical protein